jgi:hypothetical protein
MDQDEPAAVLSPWRRRYAALASWVTRGNRACEPARLDAGFNAAEEVLANEGLKGVFKEAILNGFAVLAP